MWKDKIKKQRSKEQQLRMDALDFADDILDIIKNKLSKVKHPSRMKDVLMMSEPTRKELRQELRELFLEAADILD